MNEQERKRLEELLAQSRPQANANFERGLEDKLVARLYEKRERKIKMNGALPFNTSYVADTPLEKQPMRFSITLVAAVLVVIFMAGTLYLMNNHDSSSSGAANQRATATFTPTAVQDAQQGCAVQTQLFAYIVQPGDTLTSIAVQFGTPVDLIAQLNCLLPNTMVAYGQVLFVPTNNISATATLPASPTMLPPSVSELQPTVVPPAFTGTPIPSWNPAGDVPAVSNFVPVIIAVEEIPENTTIEADMLREVYWPVDILPPDSYQSMADLVGQVTQNDIDKYDYVQQEDITLQ